MAFLDALKVCNKEYWSIASSGALLIPVLFGIVSGNTLYTMLALLVFPASLLFHLTKPQGPAYWLKGKQSVQQRFFLYLDTATVLLFGGYVTFLLFTSGSVEKILFVALFFIPAFYLFLRTSKTYEFEHTLWHIVVSMLAVIPLL